MSTTFKERPGELWVLMQARRFGFGRNPLRRRTDRIEVVLLWCAVLVGMLMVPIAAAVGTGVGNAVENAAEQRRSVLRSVEAKTLEATASAVPVTAGESTSRVRVEYADATGRRQEGFANVVLGTRADTQVTIWLDQSGRIVPGPRSKGDASAIGGTVGLFTVALAWLLLWGVVRLCRVPLDRRRRLDLDREWQTVAPRWLRGQK